MASTPNDVWSAKVSRVFNPKPRIAADDDTRWIPRVEEDRLRRAIASEGVHACLYGPSGSGKTSLAKTVLARMGRRGRNHIYVRINNSTTWASFKSQIIENKQAKVDIDAPTGIKIGVKSLLPYIEVTGTTEQSSFRAAQERTKIVEALTLSQIAQVIFDGGICLVVDDVNFANDDLLRDLTDLAKEITDLPGDGPAKVLFVGADDIFLRIVKTEPSLKDRMDEIALGSIEDPEGAKRQLKRDRVWKFIADGLEQLGLNRPGTGEENSSKQVVECMQAIEHAADGLPKSIVRLGRTIAEMGYGRSRISTLDIKKAAQDMTRRNFQYYRANYRTLVENLRRDQLLPQICTWMFRHGASSILEVERLAEDLRPIAPRLLVEESLLALSGMGFLVMTGSGSSVFFARDPLLAHTLGVALSFPEICGIEQSYFGMDATAKQLFLPFSSPRDPESQSRIR
jgi:hypothetical protein